MTTPTAKASSFQILLLGIAQILVWGGSFFILAVLADPVVRETGWSRQWVYGGLSLGVLVSGLLAPACGRLIARQGGRTLLSLSGLGVAAGLVLMASAQQLPVFLLAWVVMGIGMAAGLYDALFATLGTCYGTQARSAISGITLVSGFCTAITWPVAAFLVSHLGWRGACLAYAAYNILLKRWAMPRVPSWQLLYLQMVVAMVAQLPFYLASPKVGLHADNWYLVAYAGTMASIVATWMWMTAVAKLGPSRSIMFFNLTPLLTALIASAWAKEQLHSYLWIGGAMTILGVLLAELWKTPLRRAKPRASTAA